MTGFVRALHGLLGGQNVVSFDQTLHNWLKAEAAGGLREIAGKVVRAPGA
jgi:hypothetical protein